MVTGVYAHGIRPPRCGFVAGQLAALLPRDARVLDVGCARGGQLEALAKAGFTRLAGIDPSTACVAQARSRVRAEVREGWIGDIVGECDLLILGSVLEHLREVGPILAQPRGALAPEPGSTSKCRTPRGSRRGWTRPSRSSAPSTSTSSRRTA